MKTRLIKIILLLLVVFILSFVILKFKTMTIKEFLYDKNNNHWNELYINKHGNVEYNKRVILNNNFVPLNNANAYSYTELDILFAAQKIKPREGCNPADYIKNGRLGCFMDIPDKE